MRVIKSNNGEMLVEGTKVKQIWKEYFEKLLNQANPRERRKIRTEERYVGNIIRGRNQKCVEEDEEGKSSRS